MARQEFLMHQGVKGMKWGVRKRYQAERSKTLMTGKQVAKNGKTVVAEQYKNSRFVSALKAAFPNKMKDAGSEKVFSLKVDGKNVGMSSFEHRPGGEINLTYLGINKKDRGQGYASAAMQQAIAYGKQSGAKKLTLEVPAGVPDALHIYEKHGFKVVPGSSPSGDEQGLIPMVYKINSVKHADSFVDDDDLERAFDLTFKFSPEELEAQANSLAMSSQYLLDRQKFLMHHGVKGMRWGRRKAVESGSSSRNASPSKGIDVKTKEQDAKSLAMRNSAATLAGIGSFVVARQAGANSVVAAASGVTMMAVLARLKNQDHDKEL